MPARHAIVSYPGLACLPRSGAECGQSGPCPGLGPFPTRPEHQRVAWAPERHSPGLSLQRTLAVSEQIQEPRALFLALQLAVVQVLGLVLQIQVALLLPLLLPLPLQVGSVAPADEAPAWHPWPPPTARPVLSAGAAAAPAPPGAAPARARAPAPSPTRPEGDAGHGPGAPPRRKISV